MTPVAQLIKETKLTQNILSEKLGMAESEVSRHKHNNKKGNLEIAIEMARTLGVKSTTFKINGAVVNVEIE